MADTLAPVSGLERRLRVEVGSLTGADLDAAEDALADVSALVHATARDAGLTSPWTASSVPDEVRVIVLRAAARQYRNPDGYTSENYGGAYSWSRPDEETTAYLTTAEEAKIAAAAQAGQGGGSRGFTGSVRTPLAYSQRPPRRPAAWWAPEG